MRSVLLMHNTPAAMPATINKGVMPIREARPKADFPTSVAHLIDAETYNRMVGLVLSVPAKRGAK